MVQPVPNIGAAVSSPVQPLRRANLPATIAERLRREIFEGTLRPGTQLPGHRELAAIYAVSVGSVREAISMLVSEGLVTTRAGRGTFVADGERHSSLPSPRPLDRDQVEELVEAREILETQIVRLAARRAGPEHVARIEALAERLRSTMTDTSGFLEVDLEFHLALAEAAGNRFLLQSLTGIRSLLRKDLELSLEVAVRRHGRLAFAVDLHEHLAERVKARDEEGAMQAIADIVRGNREFVLSLYSSSETSMPAPERDDSGTGR
jgi:GntR family transcriptional regulator, transcriptional repressor for pyruvate dehydrogenase complex